MADGLEPELLAPPSGPPPPPPVETAELVLPFGQLAPLDFERLCHRLARLEGSPETSRRYGTQGQAQHGIDIYSRLPTGRYATYQCKRYADLGAPDIREAVEDFLAGPWASRSDKFVLCISQSANRTRLEEEIEAQRQVLATHEPPIAWEVWDSEELSLRLRDNDEIVSLFFGPHWTRRFFGKSGSEDLSRDDLGEVIRAAVAEGQTPRIYSNDWASAALRPRLEELQDADPATYHRLAELVGNPPEPELVRTATASPPAWLAGADEKSWDLLARIAEAVASWEAAARSWQRVGDMQEGTSRAGPYVKAADAARRAGDDLGHARLIELARAADISNARLVLHGIDDHTPPAEQLTLLATLRSNDFEELGLVAAQRTLAHILTPDTEAARESLEEVRRLLPSALLTKGLEVSVITQEARLAVMEHRAVDRGALRTGDALAESTRHELLKAGRSSEATRLLMLRADMQALLGERSRAASILRMATAEERQSQEQKEVLAMCAAGRAFDYDLAADFLSDADETPTSLRLRAEIQSEIGTPKERDEALKELEALVRTGDRGAAEAAFHRLAACLGSKAAPWSETAAVFLRSHGHERAAVQAEAVYLLQTQGFAAAEALLQPYGQTPWALATTLRCALHKSAPRDKARQAARAILAIGPGHAVRIDAARGFSRAGDFTTARDLLVSIARDPNAPEAARAEAYELLLHVVGNELGEWSVARALHEEWTKLRPDDSRAQEWAPRVANRYRTNS